MFNTVNKDAASKIYDRMFDFMNRSKPDEINAIGPTFVIVMSGLKAIESGNATSIDRSLIKPLIDEAGHNDQKKVVFNACLEMGRAGLIDAAPTQQHSSSRFIK